MRYLELANAVDAIIKDLDFFGVEHKTADLHPDSVDILFYDDCDIRIYRDRDFYSVSWEVPGGVSCTDSLATVKYWIANKVSEHERGEE
jgi:hypothetical protein